MSTQQSTIKTACQFRMLDHLAEVRSLVLNVGQIGYICDLQYIVEK